MYNIIIQIIAWFAIASCIGVFIVYLILYIKNKANKDEWFTLNRDTYIMDTDFFKWYIIPTISFAKYNGYFEICITFLKWVYCIEYHIKDDAEEEAASEARYESRHKE